MMEFLALLLFCVVLVLPTKAWENKDIVKTVQRPPNPSVLYASLGGQSETSFPKSHKSFVSDRGYPGHQSNLPSPLIPPSFVRGAQVHSARNFFETEFPNKPRRWALSTAYESQTKQIDEQDGTSDAEWDGPTSESGEENDVGPYGYDTMEPTYTYPEAKEDNRIKEEDVEKEQEVDREREENEVLPDSNFEPSYAEPFEPEENERRIAQDYLPGKEKTVEQLPAESESYKVVMEEEHQEPVRPVRRSPSPWVYRDVDRIGLPRHAACTLPLDRGVGPDELSAWYYDQSENKCRWFGYQGHGGNANRFYSRIVCEAYCVQDLEDLCQAVTCPASGLTCKLVDDEDCKQNEERYGRDWRVKCPPNHPVCMSARSTRIAPNTSTQPIPPECYQPKDSGSCQRKNPAVNFYYDSERNTCMTFYFHTCGGNDNRFETKSDCMTHCSP